VQFTFATREVNFVRGEDTPLLSHHSIPSDYKTIGLVIVNKIVSGYVQWSLMLVMDY